LLTIVQVKLIIVGSDGGSECAGDEASSTCDAVWLSTKAHAPQGTQCTGCCLDPLSARAIAVPTLMRVPDTEEEVST
jgi:hypothetical protein